MSNAIDQIVLWAFSLHLEPDTLHRYECKSYALLKSLGDMDSRFRSLTAVAAGEPEIVPAEFEEFKSLLETRIFSKDEFQDFLNLTADGRLDRGTLSRIGFSITYGNGVNGKSGPSPEAEGIRMVLQGVSACDEPNAQAILQLRCDAIPDTYSKQSIRNLLHTLIEKWECNVGGVYLKEYQRRINARDRASYAGQWLYYLPFPSLARCLPPDIRHEPFANGILIETTPHLPDANNPADIAAGKRVCDVLDEFGLVNDATYAIEGWPPDREEALYEQFISGAPADRKYTVHCINFDGYDPDRKVLLYAKLFRRLKRHPKEWGFRGWDGPVLNEAKRQVRAAAKAGGVPIEWHIGLEEPAQQVRQLLADYTDITEQQLRVIYTPLEEALRPPPT